MLHQLYPESVQGLARWRNFTLIALLSCVLCGCGKKEEAAAEPPLKVVPESAKHLIEPPEELKDEILPHTVDTATEFPQSIATLEENVEAPEIRIPDDIDLQNVEPAQPIDPSAAELLPPEPETVPQPAPEPETLQLTVDQAGIEWAELHVEYLDAQGSKRDWGGIILVPDPKKLSRAFTTQVRLARIEAHPLNDGHLRVWVRVLNITDKEISSEIACNFRSLGREADSTDFIPVAIPPNAFVDSFFISPLPEVATYTVLVK